MSLIAAKLKGCAKVKLPTLSEFTTMEDWVT